MSLTFETRQIIRQAIHERQKRLFLEEFAGKLCSGCGCPYDSFSIGCHACQDRRRRRNKDRDLEQRVKCRECGKRTRSKHGICVACQRKTAFVASRQEAA